MRVFLSFLIIAFSFTSCAQSNWSKFKKQANDAYQSRAGNGGLTNDEIVKGLKEALNVGISNASTNASKLDGFYKNPAIFIPWPSDAKKVESKLRELGFGSKVDEFTKTLNRAAEEAAKEAAPIFGNAIREMSFQDALGILKGNNTAATSYLQSKTTAQLGQKFRPVVERALNSTNATKYWTDLVNIYNRIPMVEKVNPDLAGYATDRSIVGLFQLVGSEETKIRLDPAARVSDILRKVFAK